MKINGFFTTHLLEWNNVENDREMPWKSQKDPYKIWLSEVILQQTRVAQGIGYYNKFITAFPNVHQLSKAPETTIFKLWEGLGYYNRCKNLIESAKYISGTLKGKFPDTYEGILNLKGIGPYTASAIASFAFDLPYAVIDGNVFRVLSRFFGIHEPIDSTTGKKTFTELAANLLDNKDPATYNQAIMDFGATVCKPKLPLCSKCYLNTKCVAYQEGYVDLLPIKIKKVNQKIRHFNYLVIKYKDSYLVRKRSTMDIWQNLYEFVLLEFEEPIFRLHITKTAQFKKFFKNSGRFKITDVSEIYSQKLTHQLIKGQFFEITVSNPIISKTYFPVKKNEIFSLPFPKFITTYLKDKNVSLNLK